MAVIWALEDQWSNALEVVKAFRNAKEEISWQIAPLVKDIRLLVMDKPFWCFDYTPRATNRRVHELASGAFSMDFKGC